MAHRHLAECKQQAPLPFDRQGLPNRAERVFGHRAIQASAPRRTTLESQAAEDRRVASTYQRYRVWGTEQAHAFQKDMNRLFVKDGAGWQMIDGVIFARGSEPFNIITKDARQILESSRNRTAASEIHEAIKDISRRPTPDKTGAIHHAMGAVECITRSLANDPKSTLGEIVKAKSKSHGIPPPLDEAISKLWGYSSERGRHIREGAEPTFEEAELVVTVAAAVCIYLSRKAF